jgi:hypothetical protein
MNKISMRSWYRLFCCCLIALSTSAVAQSPPLQERTQVEVKHESAKLKCIVAALPQNATVTLELRYETHVRAAPADVSKLTVEKLRQSLERPRRTSVHMRPFRTGSWRILETTFPPDAFFGEHTQHACSQGCALHEMHSIDMWRRVFVSGPSSGAPLHTNLDLSDIEERYGDTPRAVITFAGFGDSEGFGFHFEQYLDATNVTRTRALCEY